MKIFGKKKIDNRLRTIYEIKYKNKTKYYYRKNNKKIFIKKPKYANYKFNPGNKSKAFDVYLDKNPKDTINIKYKTLTDVKNTIKKLEKLYKSKKYSHKRIWQVAMIMKVRLRALKGKSSQKKLANKYYNFLKKRTKLNTFEKRKKLIFKINK
jgi:hypothetical protein